ncbi:NUDIX domain-containing protein [Lentibacter sp.]|uniref:NUDIX domain-containing protein n=1 Tax=Lentibacter sp. TaxID=2024994 RepID=UPI003F6D5B2E
MSHVFLYGTLRHFGLLETVLGSVPHDRLVPAGLENFCVARAHGQDFPLIFACNGATSKGFLLKDVTAEEKARLDHYELGFGYTLEPCCVSGLDALVYIPQAGLWQPAEPWSLESWVENAWPIVKHSAQEIMALRGVVEPKDLHGYFDRIQARAYSRHLAETQHSPADLRSKNRYSDVKLSNRSCRHIGYFRTDANTLSYPQYDGTMGKVVTREVFLSGDAAIVLPYDAKRDRVLLIEQFRLGPFGRGDPYPWLLEPIAGRIDVGETPAESAKRECIEEAGVHLDQLLPVASYYPSPGEVSTYFHTFVGLCDLPDTSAGLGGLATEAEDIKSHVVSFDYAESLMCSGEINVGPLLHLLLWLKTERNSLK